MARNYNTDCTSRSPGTLADVITAPSLSDSEAVDAIARLLSGVEWSADTIDEVAQIVTRCRKATIDDTGLGHWEAKAPRATADGRVVDPYGEGEEIEQYRGVEPLTLVFDPVDLRLHCPKCRNTEFRYEERVIVWRDFGGQDGFADGSGSLHVVYDSSNTSDGDDFPGLICEHLNAGSVGCGALVTLPENWSMSWD